MQRVFFMAAQFSARCDNALFMAAYQLLRYDGAPSWRGAALVPLFTFSTSC